MVLYLGNYQAAPFDAVHAPKRALRIPPEPQEPSAPKALETGQRRETWGLPSVCFALS